MSSILPFTADLHRRTEAQVIAEIRRDCIAAGLDPHQVQTATRRARSAFRYRRAAVLPTVQAVAERARFRQSTPMDLLRALNTAIDALLHGHSPAVAIPAGNRSLRNGRQSNAESPKPAA